MVSVPSSRLLPTSRCSILGLGNSFQGRKQMFTLLLRAGKLFVQIEWSTKAWDDSLPLLWMEPCPCPFLHLETSVTATGWSIARIPTDLVMAEARPTPAPCLLHLFLIVVKLGEPPLDTWGSSQTHFSDTVSPA